MSERGPVSPEQEWTLAELAEMSGVPSRTVRYYITEGLLPPPATTGRNATYTAEHLDRLQAITTLKEQYLPLKEIRRQLDRLSRDQMRDPVYLATLSHFSAVDKAMTRMRDEQSYAPRSAAREYLEDHMENASIRSRRPAAARIAEPNSPAYNFGRQAGRRAHEAAGDAWIRMPAGENGEVMVKEDVARKLGKRLADKVQELRSLLDERS